MAVAFIQPELMAKLLAGKSKPNHTVDLSAMDIHQLQQSIRRLCSKGDLKPDPAELAFWAEVVETPFLFSLIRKAVPQLDIYELVSRSSL